MSIHWSCETTINVKTAHAIHILFLFSLCFEMPVNQHSLQTQPALINNTFTSCADTLSLSSHQYNFSSWCLFYEVMGSPQVFSSVIGWVDRGREWGQMWNCSIIYSHYLCFSILSCHSFCLISSFIEYTNIFSSTFFAYSPLSCYCRSLSWYGFIFPNFHSF